MQFIRRSICSVPLIIYLCSYHAHAQDDDDHTSDDPNAFDFSAFIARLGGASPGSASASEPASASEVAAGAGASHLPHHTDEVREFQSGTVATFDPKSGKGQVKWGSAGT